MGLLIFFLILFIVLVGGGWLIGKSFGNFLFPSKKEEKITFINNITHNHYHEHKNISIIDDKTKEEVIVYQKSIDIKKKKASN